MTCAERHNLNSSALDDVEHRRHCLVRCEDDRVFGVITQIEIGCQKLRGTILHLLKRRILPQEFERGDREGCCCAVSCGTGHLGFRRGQRTTSTGTLL